MNGLQMKYFVLKPNGDQMSAYARASRSAMKVYADEIRVANPSLALDIERWVSSIEDGLQP